MSTINQELEVLESFIFLLKIRHGESLNIEINIEDHYRETYIPTLALQMLLENAVKHNSFSREDPLEVKIKVEEEYLVVSNKIRTRHSTENSTKVGRLLTIAS